MLLFIYRKRGVRMKFFIAIVILSILSYCIFLLGKHQGKNDTKYELEYTVRELMDYCNSSDFVKQLRKDTTLSRTLSEDKTSELSKNQKYWLSGYMLGLQQLIEIQKKI